VSLRVPAPGQPAALQRYVVRVNLGPENSPEPKEFSVPVIEHGSSADGVQHRDNCRPLLRAKPYEHVVEPDLILGTKNFLRAIRCLERLEGRLDYLLCRALGGGGTLFHSRTSMTSGLFSLVRIWGLATPNALMLCRTSLALSTAWL